MKTKDLSPLEQVGPNRPEPVDTLGAGLQPGRVLDARFLLTEVVSRSGMATVFKAEDQHHGGQVVAVKVPHLVYESDPNFFSRFEREEQIGLALHHPLVLKFIPVRHKSRPYLVTEYLQGCTLEQWLQVVRPVPEKEALKFASRVCEALQYLHEHGVIHRDLKPQNIMLCGDGLRIMDFGLARNAARRSITHFANAASMGTPDYMAPEQVEGKRAEARTDLYNLGALLYEMLTGSVPFPNENPWAALNARVTGDPAAPRALNPNLSPQAEEIVLRALQRKPGDRYPTATAMKADLDHPDQVQVSGLAERLQQPGAWKPGLFERPWVLVAVLLSPLVIGLLVTLVLLLTRL